MRALRWPSLLLLLLGPPVGAWANEPSPVATSADSSAQASPASSGDAALPDAHELIVYGSTGLQAYLSEARTFGGVGGGLGIRATLDDRFLLQADLSYLLALGNAFSLRLAAGIQRPGFWTPALLATVSTFFGDHLTFLTPAHPTPVLGPAFALGLSVAPLRFSIEGAQVSLLEVGAGIGTDFPGLGLSYQVRVIEVGASF